jgi:DNA polymerase (family X)
VKGDRRSAARVLGEIAALERLRGANPFRVRAFERAARAIESSPLDLHALAASGELTRVPGVGPATASVAAEVLLGGSSALHERIAAETPPALLDLTRVEGLGATRAGLLVRELGIDSLDALEAAIRDGRVAKVPGFGARTAERMLRSLPFLRDSRGRRLLPHAMELGEGMEGRLRELDGVSRVEVAGGLRRALEVHEEVALVAAARAPAAAARAFAESSGGTAAARPEGGHQVEIALTDGFVVRALFVPGTRFAATLLHATGSAEHLAELSARARRRGLELRPDGLFRGGERVRSDDEEALYGAIGLPWIPPELREGRGEVADAAAGRLPRLLSEDDLRGTFHCHTVYSDGRATVEEMARAARGRGWSYLGLADHSRSAGYAGGLQIPRVRAQQAEIDAWNAEAGGEGPRLLKGIESEILPDGSLDYPPGVLRSFDYVVASLHGGRGDPEASTRRVVEVLKRPQTTILGHATGRLLLSREPTALDLEAVLDTAAAHGVVVEINADPRRLDLDWRLLAGAAERGIRFAVNPDAHSAAALGNVRWGVMMARKGGLEREMVVNAWSLEEVEEFLAERKRGGKA